MLEKIKNMPEWAFLILYLGTLFCYQALIGLQGFDMHDEGWVLSAYQQIFNDPSTCEYQFLYYNALPIGGLWNILFGSWGIYGFRILSALCSVAIACVVYLLLRKEINRWCIFLGIMLFNLGYIMVFHHNGLTALLVAVSALFLYKGLIASNKWWIFLAGIFVGINIFTRIPNVSMFALALAFVPYYLYNKNIRTTFQLISMAILGVLIGVGCEILLLHILGHLNLFIDNLSTGLSAASAEDSSHNILNIFKVYGKNYHTVYHQIAVLLGLPLLLVWVCQYVKDSKYQKIIYWATVVLYFLSIYSQIRETFILYALCYVIFGVYIFKHWRNTNKVYLITIATIVLFFLPFGSDYGINNMGPFCIWISMPLCIGLLFELLKENETVVALVMRKFACVFFIAFICQALYNVSLNCYFDSGSRLKKTSRPNAVFATTFTTLFKAEQLDTLMTHLQPLVEKNDYLLCYPSLPMANYLTETRPYLGTSWPWVYDYKKLKCQFVKAEEDINELPIILRNKSKIAMWHLYASDWDSVEAEDQWNFPTVKMELIKDFIYRYDYYVVWENELFQVLKTDCKKHDTLNE